MFDFFKYKPHSDTGDFELTFSDKDYKQHISDDIIEISANVDKNYDYVRNTLHTDINGDIKIRWFNCRISGQVRRGFLIWVDGLANSSLLNDYILRPLITGSDMPAPPLKGDISYFTENLIHQGAVAYEKNVRKLVLDVNTGNASLFIDGCTNGASFDVKTWEHRGVDSPVNEAVVQGPHEGFNEVLRCNTALIRKSVNSPDLIMETYFLGNHSKTPASLAYIDGTINPDLLSEIQKRLSSISADYVLSVYDVEKMLEERAFTPMPQILTTERPDKVTRALIEGRAALCINGSSQALILPSNITDIIASPEDVYLRRPYSVFIKLVRILAVLLSLLTPGLYLAMTTFHTDAILTDMLIAINSASSNVPFSPLTEVLIMELAFELIKEAGVRIPGAIGSSLGIVGGLILGQSAVSAGLVSPIVIIIVSVCGIASFAIPSYSLSFAFRISRFAYIFAGALFGIAGIVSTLCVHLGMILSTKSFGVPSCVPFSPSTAQHSISRAIFGSHANITPPSYLKANKEREVQR